MKTAAPQVDRELATEWASWFQAIGDPTRILILYLLSSERRPMTTGEITSHLDVGQSTVSHHLARLADVGFVLVERIGTTSRWRVNDTCIGAFPSAAEVIMGTVGPEFTDALENRP